MSAAEDRLGQEGEPAAVGLHYLLHGYVCGGGCFKPSTFEGWATFTQIFNARPDGCRYAIAQLVPIRVNPDSDPNTPLVLHDQPLERFACFDLYDERLVRGTPLRNRGLMPAPEPRWTAHSADALVMKAMALYDRP